MYVLSKFKKNRYYQNKIEKNKKQEILGLISKCISKVV